MSFNIQFPIVAIHWYRCNNCFMIFITGEMERCPFCHSKDIVKTKGGL